MTLPEDTVHVRVKRKNQTFFVLCTKQEKVALLKHKIAKVMDRDPKTLRLLRGGVVIDEEVNLHDQSVEGGAEILQVVTQDGSGAWEVPQYDELQLIAPEEPAAA